MPVLLDLDDTLVDRSGAFARWAAEAVPAWGGDAGDDMAGGRAVGLETAWVAHGRPWTPAWSPRLQGRDPADVLAAVARAIRDAG